ncbi:MAG: sensor domain-containing diguanylate cyclase [Aliivibrio sp.]|uniref:sensor domain-containing diguanylate cyclase n=1 Tax=Aliivibrio sp. TaxID=1872443 RepID=UPI001A3EC88E|nr:sensor domain-containing diguanylate cyclase [Aliivibrio sp.]
MRYVVRYDYVVEDDEANEMGHDKFPMLDEHILMTIFEVVSDGLWDWNANTGYVYRSPGWYRMLGYDTDEFENTVFTWESVIHPDDFDRVMCHFDDYINKKSDAYKIKYRCRTQSGDYLWIEDRARIAQWNDDGSVGRMIGAHRDISSEKLLEQQNRLENASLQKIIDMRTKELNEANQQLNIKVSEIESLANTDSLTLLSNRYHFEKQLLSESARAKRFKEPLSLISFDLDNFKPVNDRFGHSAGDFILNEVANMLKVSIRSIDTSARWGGDEFVVLLPNTALKHALIVAEMLREYIDLQITVNDFSVTASFGVVQLHKSEDPFKFIIRADEALYTSKNTGKNRVSSV